MTLTQALYDQICQERHFELLILCNTDLGRDAMTFDYNAIDDCIHVIDGSQEMFESVANNYDDLYDKLVYLIDCNADFTGDYVIGEITTFLDTLNVIRLDSHSIESFKCVVGTDAVEELLDALQTSDRSVIYEVVHKIDAQLMRAGYQPVLTM